MNNLGMQIGWLVLQVTGVAMLTLSLLPWLARREARSAVVVVLSAMVILLTVTGVAFCPLPDGCRWCLPLMGSEASFPTATGDIVIGQATQKIETEAAPLHHVRSWVQNLNDRAYSPGWQSGWVIFLSLYSLGFAVAGLRMLAGWFAVRALRAQSRPVIDAECLHLADTLRRAVDCNHEIEVRQCDEPGLIATAGWWQPVIFLPAEWPSFAAAEQRAVLAHEIAHIRHRDYFIGLWSGFCQVVHFYHPLVHWLALHLRWQQEVAADALAARVVGGPDTYLKSLARLALRCPARTPAGVMGWSGQSLLRRIQMLRQAKKRPPLGWLVRSALVAMLAAIAVLAATVGTSATQSEDSQPQSFRIIPAADMTQYCDKVRVVTEIRVVTVSNDFFKRLSYDLRDASGYLALSDLQVFMFLEAVQGDRKASIRQMPRMMALSGKWSSIQSGANCVVQVKTLAAADLGQLEIEVKAKIDDIEFAKSACLADGGTVVLWAEMGADRANIILATARIHVDVEAHTEKPKVEPHVSRHPSTVSLGEVKAGEVSDRKVLVRGVRPFRVIKIDGQDDAISVRPTSKDKKTVHVLTVTLKPATPGKLSRQIRVQTDLKEGDIEFVAEAKVLP